MDEHARLRVGVAVADISGRRVGQVVWKSADHFDVRRDNGTVLRLHANSLFTVSAYVATLVCGEAAITTEVVR